ncbi:hypothetical protein TPY_2475 [Sulfobacillus acidophilus TPY]|nr:hypothetical protein TPY_2475 [Sulfobacillus acidophilus TPY]
MKVHEKGLVHPRHEFPKPRFGEMVLLRHGPDPFFGYPRK